MILAARRLITSAACLALHSSSACKQPDVVMRTSQAACGLYPMVLICLAYNQQTISTYKDSMIRDVIRPAPLACNSIDYCMEDR